MAALRVVVMGASLGGLETLPVVLRDLPGDLGVPVVLVQHRVATPDSGLAAVLSRLCGHEFSEPESGEAIVPGRYYLAPPDYHLLLESGYFALSTDEPVMFTRPSIDLLFESAACTYGEGAIGVVLTGASADGAEGAAAIAHEGGVVLIQDPATARSPVAPLAAASRVPDARILRPEELSATITQLCGLP